MTAAPSNKSRPRRHEEMKYAYAGPFVTLLSPIRAVKPWRDLTGKVADKQPRYTPRSAESWTIGSALAQKVIGRFVPTINVGASQLDALVDEFGREYGSVLDEVDDTPGHFEGNLGANIAGGYKPKRRRRGSRGGRKPVAS